MGKDDPKDKRNLDELIADIEKQMDQFDEIPEESQPPEPPKPEVKKPAPPPKKPAARPAPKPPTPQTPEQEQEEIDESTARRLDFIRKTLTAQKVKQDNEMRKVKFVLGLAGVLVLVLLVVAINYASKKPGWETEPTSKGNKNVAAPVDSTTGDLYKQERESFREVQRKLASGDFEQGLKEAHDLVLSSPQSPQAADSLLLMASTYRYNLQNPDEAVRAYSKFLKNFQDHKQAPKVQKYLIELLVEQGRGSEAKVLLDRMLEEEPTKQDKVFAEHFLKQIQ